MKNKLMLFVFAMMTPLAIAQPPAITYTHVPTRISLNELDQMAITLAGYNDGNGTWVDGYYVSPEGVVVQIFHQNKDLFNGNTMSHGDINNLGQISFSAYNEVIPCGNEMPHVTIIYDTVMDTYSYLKYDGSLQQLASWPTTSGFTDAMVSGLLPGLNNTGSFVHNNDSDRNSNWYVNMGGPGKLISPNVKYNNGWDNVLVSDNNLVLGWNYANFIIWDGGGAVSQVYPVTCNTYTLEHIFNHNYGGENNLEFFSKISNGDLEHAAMTADEKIFIGKDVSNVYDNEFYYFQNPRTDFSFDDSHKYTLPQLTNQDSNILLAANSSGSALFQASTGPNRTPQALLNANVQGDFFIASVHDAGPNRDIAAWRHNLSICPHYNLPRTGYIFAVYDMNEDGDLAVVYKNTTTNEYEVETVQGQSPVADALDLNGFVKSESYIDRSRTWIWETSESSEMFALRDRLVEMASNARSTIEISHLSVGELDENGDPDYNRALFTDMIRAFAENAVANESQNGGKKPVFRIVTGDRNPFTLPMMYLELAQPLINPEGGGGPYGKNQWPIHLALAPSATISGEWNHSKMFIFDKEHMIIGGHWHGYSQYQNPGGLDTEADLSMEVHGQIAAEATQRFDIWYDQSSPALGDPQCTWGFGDLGCVGNIPEPPAVTATTPPPNVPIYFLQRGRETDGFHLAADAALRAAYSSAKDSIDIVQPGFINYLDQPDTLFEILAERLLAGVHVRIILSYEETGWTCAPYKDITRDVIIQTLRDVGAQQGYSFQQIAEASCRLELRSYRQKPEVSGAIHAKYYAVDNSVVYIGSQNQYSSGYRDGYDLIKSVLPGSQFEAGGLVSSYLHANEVRETFFEPHWSSAEPADTCMGPIGYYTLSQEAGLADATAYENDGSPFGNPPYHDMDRHGNNTGALTFAGGHINLPMQINQSSTSNGFTVSQWILPQTSVGHWGVFGSQFPGPAWALEQVDQTWVIHDGSGPLSPAIPFAVAPGSWVQLITVFDRIAGEIRFYQNGQLTTIAGVVPGSSDSITLGAAVASPNFAGSMDDVRIFDYALSQEEVDYYNGPTAYYKMNNTGNTTWASDSMGRHHASGPTPISTANRFGIPDRATFLDGTMALSTPITMDQTSTSRGMSVSLWVQPQVTSGTTYLIGSGTSAWGLALVDGMWRVNTGMALAFTGLTADVNLWQHLVVTWDPAQSSIRISKNGTEVGVPIKYPTTSLPLAIGNNGSNGQFFQGNVDSVKIYQHALSDKEREALMTR